MGCLVEFCTFEQTVILLFFGGGKDGCFLDIDSDDAARGADSVRQKECVVTVSCRGIDDEITWDDDFREEDVEEFGGAWREH